MCSCHRKRLWTARRALGTRSQAHSSSGWGPLRHSDNRSRSNVLDALAPDGGCHFARAVAGRSCLRVRRKHEPPPQSVLRLPLHPLRVRGHASRRNCTGSGGRGPRRCFATGCFGRWLGSTCDGPVPSRQPPPPEFEGARSSCYGHHRCQFPVRDVGAARARPRAMASAGVLAAGARSIRDGVYGWHARGVSGVGQPGARDATGGLFVFMDASPVSGFEAFAVVEQQAQGDDFSPSASFR